MALRNIATKGLFWSAADKVGEQITLFVVQLVLARLLAPEEFGLIAMVAVFMVISRVFVDAGFSQAIIQRSELPKPALNAVFAFNIVVSLFVAGMLWLAAPFIADFYNEPVLTGVVRWLGVSIVPGAFIGVHRVLLEKRMDFRRIMVLSLPATVFGAVVGIWMAAKGYGVWALVIQGLAGSAIRVPLFWFGSGWRPGVRMDFQALVEMFPYGSRLALAQLIDQVFSNLYPLVIGKLYSPVEVGYFQRAQSFQRLPNYNILPVILRVAFPLFSAMKDDVPKFRKALRKAASLNALFGFVVMGVLAGLAEPMVVTLIGEKWLPCVLYLKLLCVGGALYPIHAINVNALTSLGRSDLFLNLEFVKKGGALAVLAVTAPYGVVAMICGGIVTSIIALGINTHFTRKLVGYGLVSQLRDFVPMMVLGLSLFVLLSLWVMWLGFLPSPVQLIGGGILAGGMCVLVVRWLPATLREEIQRVIVKMPSPIQAMARGFGIH